MSMLLNPTASGNLENVDPIIKQAIRFEIGDDQKLISKQIMMRIISYLKRRKTPFIASAFERHEPNADRYSV